MKTELDLFADFLTEVITRHWDELEISVFGKCSMDSITELYSMYKKYESDVDILRKDFVLESLTKFVIDNKSSILSVLQRVS